jgi:hypothetical protein
VSRAIVVPALLGVMGALAPAKASIALYITEVYRPKVVHKTY